MRSLLENRFPWIPTRPSSAVLTAIHPHTVIAISGYLLLAFSWYWHKRGRDRWALWVIVLSAGLLRLGPSLDPSLHLWDERYHALVAKNLAEDPFTPTLYADPSLPHADDNWTQAHVWLHKPPFAMWCMAGSIKLFGTHAWVVRLPSILFSCIAVALCFAIASALVSTSVAFWSAFLFAINGHLVELASGRTATDHVDAILVALVLAGAYSAIRMARRGEFAWALACGACLGLAFLTKTWPSLLILAIAVTGSFIHSGNGPVRTSALLGTVVLAGLALALPWQVHVHLNFPMVAAESSRSTLNHFGQDIEQHARPWYYYFSQLPMIHGEFAPIAVIWSAIMILRKRSWPPLILLVWFAVPFTVFSFAVSKMPAYTAIAAPALFILIAMAIADWTTQERTRVRSKIVASIAALFLVVLPFRFSWDRVRPFDKVAAAYAMPAHLVDPAPLTVVLNCPDPIDLMFRTPVAAAYSGVIDQDEQERLKARGYRFVHFQAD